ncbi:1,4-dihydroxy-6-naphthoate synthase [Geothermobacter ehrlichii]|uniref:1,4-dihydroxy-6-naphtoate synthase n=1 Tax=Geothermobacter ehrlichii TaxID=213224 RepID=A0A5D3WJQ8_9BACT|nr:1,4-dihydroxy-6-naphthoate synthase [Geothermobacter ehrlichii]TYO99202.1 1,4-dihydroxy-6-naphthoate synthase [Geothermobacter ehrlichii]
MTDALTLGFSPCPNDTFIFHALVHGLLPDAPTVRARLEDVETLNQLARRAVLDLTKISYHAFGHLRRDYVLLRSGGALGRGCGPLLVARPGIGMSDLRQRPVAIPGELTTANLLLQLCAEGFDQTVVMPFDRIMPAVAAGRCDAGVIIHESRFTYQRHGLVRLLDLGQWWEEETGCPIPLGGILARRALGPDLIRRVDAAIRRSVEHAFAHPDAPRAYILCHAQEMEETVVDRHIALYVNDFSRDLGDEGERAVRLLLQKAEERGLIPACDLPLFID